MALELVDLLKRANKYKPEEKNNELEYIKFGISIYATVRLLKRKPNGRIFVNSYNLHRADIQNV